MSLPSHQPVDDSLCEVSAQLGALRDLVEGLRVDPSASPSAPVRILPASEGEQAYAQLLSDARSRMRTTSRLPVIGPPLWWQTAHIVDMLRSGIAWQDIYDPEVMNTEGMLQHVQEVGAAGEKARSLPRVPLKMTIADDDCAIVAIEYDSGVRQNLLVNSSGLLRDLIALFDTLWFFATPIPDRAGSRAVAGGLTSSDRQLIALLASGATDEAIARHLDVNVRTVQRRVRRVQDTLGARSRFQAGIQAARRGFV